MNQQQLEDNKKWIPNPGAFVCMLTPPKIETNLRRPYQHELPMAECRDLVSELKAICQERHGLQCRHYTRKAVTRGIRLSVFLLGWHEDVPETRWYELVEETLAPIRKLLGENFIPYVEPWNAERKFQARWEGYIKYQEL